jgi:hypothetical protein
MLTFFVQIYDEDSLDEDAEEGPVVWVGTDLRELYDFEELDPVLRQHHIKLPHETRMALYGDRDEGR